MQSREWNNKIEVKKGNIGEDIIQEYFENEGYVIYKAVTDKSHPVDLLAFKNNLLEFAIEVKTYPKYKIHHYTGVNENNYNSYIDFFKKNNKDVFLIFIDIDMKKIYGNFISKLIEEVLIDGEIYPSLKQTKTKGNKMVFHLSMLENLNIQLEDEIIKKIKEYDTNNR